MKHSHISLGSFILCYMWLKGCWHFAYEISWQGFEPVTFSEIDKHWNCFSNRLLIMTKIESVLSQQMCNNSIWVLVTEILPYQSPPCHLRVSLHSTCTFEWLMSLVMSCISLYNGEGVMGVWDIRSKKIIALPVSHYPSLITKRQNLVRNVQLQDTKQNGCLENDA